MLDTQTIKRITEAADIVAVVGDFVTLKKQASRWVGLCPFHDDRHMGNFVVYPRKNCYKCFACDAKGDSVKFLMEHEKMTFTEAIRWLGKKFNIYIDDESPNISTAAPRTPPPPLPTLYLPTKMVEARLNTRGNVLCEWLRALPWDSIQAERVEGVLRDYKVGTSKYGHTIFWQIDENGGIRTGKMMKYKGDGHRDKQSSWNFDYIHSTLARRKFECDPLPFPNIYDPDKQEMRQTLFGMHLLNRFKGADVHIVESEKTALICAIYFGNNDKQIWMACGGKNNLTKEKLAPIIKERRVIALHPDKDGMDQWSEYMKKLEYKRAYIDNTILTFQWKEEDGEKADMADVLVRLMDDARRDRAVKKLSDILPSVEPAARKLIDNLNLEEQ